MKKTFRSKDEHQEGEGDFSLIDDQGQKLLCSFDPKRAQEYGIGTAASCGRLYALCPICATSWGKGWWKLLNNARKCCSNRDIEQEELEVDALNKERAVLLRASMLMKPYYGIISKSKSKAEAWMKFNEIDPKRCIFMDEMKDVKYVVERLDKFDIFFLGKRHNYLTHPALSHPIVMAELLDQEAVRSHQYIVLYTHLGVDGKTANTTIIPVKSRRQYQQLARKLEEDNNKLMNPVRNLQVRLFVRKGSLMDLEVYSPSDMK